MELKVFKDTIASWRTLGSGWASSETEILIPDYCRRIQDRQVPDHACCAAEPCVRRTLAEQKAICAAPSITRARARRLLCAPSRNSPLASGGHHPPGSTPTARPRSGASRNTAAPSVSTALTCAARTSSAPRWPCGGVELLTALADCGIEQYAHDAGPAMRRDRGKTLTAETAAAPRHRGKRAGRQLAAGSAAPATGQVSVQGTLQIQICAARAPAPAS